jgi:DNA-binding response OmpR family regulator
MSPKPNILIIEADAYLAGIYARKLELESCAVRVADNLEDARKKINAKCPDAVVIDVAIENKTGFDFVEEIKKKHGLQNTPVIVITQLGDRTSIEIALQKGADDYLIKGHFVPQEAAKKIKRIAYEK